MLKRRNTLSLLMMLTVTCGGTVALVSKPSHSKDVNNQARKECRKHFGGSVEFDHFDRTTGLIYCLDGGRMQTIRLAPSEQAAKPVEVAPKTPPTEQQETETQNSVPACTTGVDCSVTVTAINESSVTNFQAAYMEQARQRCTQQVGPTSKVDHFDYTNWQVYCTQQ